ncbi:MAG: hypothetical protein DRO87_11280 [Candidatus Thorarchaeota archaeon]|nr:MAG: hypothetical protein DRO87_11280 [Candidatus Thorarchaeota archaeon]
MNTEELKEAIRVYNLAEAEQVARRDAIFSALHDRKGYRMLKVGQHAWSVNQCNGSLAQDLKTMQDAQPGQFIEIKELGKA